MQCSSELFPGRKSYTALKSCFHRNLEVFKQVHAFQMFSANHFRQMQAENPNAQQPSVDSVLDAARVAGLNVGTLNVKVIDRWYETGWYELFRKRCVISPPKSCSGHCSDVSRFQVPRGPKNRLTRPILRTHRTFRSKFVDRPTGAPYDGFERAREHRPSHSGSSRAPSQYREQQLDTGRFSRASSAADTPSNRLIRVLAVAPTAVRVPPSRTERFLSPAIINISAFLAI